VLHAAARQEDSDGDGGFRRDRLQRAAGQRAAPRRPHAPRAEGGEEEEEEEEGGAGAPPLEREQKRLRRLLRNRASAQLARERRKEHEAAVAARQAVLKAAVATLQGRLGVAAKENEALRSLLRTVVGKPQPSAPPQPPQPPLQASLAPMAVA